MSSFLMTKRIEAPVETVFEVATDLEQAAQHIRGIERIELLTPGPVGKGTRWRETRRMMGRESTETLEITTFEPPHCYTISCDSCGCHFESTFRFTPHECDGATHVSLSVMSQPETLFAKLMSPIGNLFAGKTMRQCMDDDLEDIKRVAEQRAAAVTSS